MLAVPDVQLLCRANDFTRSAIEKGLRYAAQGRVVNSNVIIRSDAMQIHARVSGSQRRPYEVTVDVSTEGGDMFVEGECSCPVAFNCKHVVAAIAAATGHAPPSKKDVAPLARIMPAEPVVEADPPLSPFLQQWLNNMKPAEEHAAPAVEKQLRYVLSLTPHREGSRPLVTLMQTTRKKNGEFGKAARCSFFGRPADLLDNPSHAHDRDLLVSLFGHYGFSPEFHLSGPAGATLLRRLLETKRCHWKDPNENALALGESRPAKPVWNELDDGSQKTAFEVLPPTTTLLPLAPPWYVDTAAGTCGPLAVEGDPNLAMRWLNAPIVKPEETKALARSVAVLSLPAPRNVSIRARRGIRPIPILRLARMNFPKPLLAVVDDNWRRDHITGMDAAWVEFDYDGLRVKTEAEGAFVTRRKADTLERIYRMPRVERDYLDELGTSGLEPVSEILWNSTPDELATAFSLRNPKEWMSWVIEVLPEAQSHGWRVEIDPGFSYRPTQVEAWYSETEGSGEDWFSYELGIVVEGQRFNLLPMLGNVLKLLNQDGPGQQKVDVVQWKLDDGRIVQLPADRLRAIAATLAELFDPDALTDGRLRVGKLRAAELIDLNDDTPWRGPNQLRELAAKLKSFHGIAPSNPPQGLRATLRPYQAEGVSWLQFLREHNFGGILADDMGLGKTVQAIAHILAEKEAGRAAGPNLVIAPTSLMGNWRSEAAKFAPDLKTLILHGGARKERFDEIPSHDLVVTSYALLTKDREILEKQNFHLLILDEAQYIKNPRTQWAEIVRSLSAKHRLCMTGTPMENHLGELWSLLHFLSPGYLGSEKQFRRIYRDPIEKAGDQDRRSALAKRIRPFIMRRRKEDVVKELPPKTEIIRNVELDGRQRDLYETIRLAMHERVRAEVASKGMARSQIIILDALLKLRQVCCDPRLVKLDRARQVKESAKLDLLKEMLPEMISEGRRILLFSQFTGMLDLIEDAVNALKIPFVRLTGSTTDRETPVRRFQNGDVPLFLISLKAGGTGLNLTAADTVIHYDPWWNPAVERQATDRAHRIGQDKKVFVYKLVTTGTVEEKILAMQERKAELVAGLLGEGAQHNLQLSKEDLDHLFDPLA